MAHGIYYKPKIDPVLGELRPGADEVVGMLAQKEKIKVRLSGAYALHRLGLTTQVPTNLVYITNGHSKQFKLGKLQIKFKATSPKKLETIGEISSLLIQALEEIGTENIDPVTEKKILALSLKEDSRVLKHDLSLAPAKVNDYIVRLLKRMKMTGWLKLTDSQRKATIDEAEQISGISAKAIEKDWWVTLALKALFQSAYAEYMIFKGGTSLSKCWKLIARFSYPK